MGFVAAPFRVALGGSRLAQQIPQGQYLLQQVGSRTSWVAKQKRSTRALKLSEVPEPRHQDFSLQRLRLLKEKIQSPTMTTFKLEKTVEVTGLALEVPHHLRSGRRKDKVNRKVYMTMSLWQTLIQTRKWRAPLTLSRRNPRRCP